MTTQLLDVNVSARVIEPVSTIRVRRYGARAWKAFTDQLGVSVIDFGGLFHRFGDFKTISAWAEGESRLEAIGRLVEGLELLGIPIAASVGISTLKRA
jgi:hypothetical protein